VLGLAGETIRAREGGRQCPRTLQPSRKDGGDKRVDCKAARHHTVGRERKCRRPCEERNLENEEGMRDPRHSGARCTGIQRFGVPELYMPCPLLRSTQPSGHKPPLTYTQALTARSRAETGASSTMRPRYWHSAAMTSGLTARLKERLTAGLQQAATNATTCVRCAMSNNHFGSP
jgi:hypothetical protein